MQGLCKLFNTSVQSLKANKYSSELIQTWEQAKMTMSSLEDPKANSGSVKRTFKKYQRFLKNMVLKLLASISTLAQISKNRTKMFSQRQVNKYSKSPSDFLMSNILTLEVDWESNIDQLSNSWISMNSLKRSEK